MLWFRTKSREERIVDYMVGAGLLSNVPRNDAAFYYLAGSCSSVLWPTIPRSRTKSISVGNDRTSEESKNQKRTIAEIGDQPADQVKTASDDVLDKIFKPKPSLPFPLFQETFRRWKSSMDMQLRFRRLRSLRADIVLQPLDEFPAFLTEFEVQLKDDERFGFFQLLQEFMKVFFTGADIRLSSATSTVAWDVTSRVHKLTGKQQLLAAEVNQQLSRFCLPSDAFGVVGITWTDLFPNDKENFALGEADVEHHSAVVCFGRFDPNQPGQEAQHVDISRVDADLIWKMMKVVSHETCHLFYMSHCVFFDCLMNQSHSVSEAMSQPLYLCPVCMRKLQKVLRFPTVVEYMENMLRFLGQLVDAGLANQQLISTVTWLEHCIAVIETKSAVSTSS